MPGDWVKLHRKILDSAVFANPELLRLWILCMVKANHKDEHVAVDGLTAPVAVKRGQFITGRFALHRDLYSRKRSQRRRIGLRNAKSPSTVFRWLEALAQLGCLSIKTNSHFSLVTLEKYSIYQDVPHGNEQPLKTPMNSGCTAGEQRLHTNKNEEEDKERVVGFKSPPTPRKRKAIVPSEGFDEFWENYPRKDAKAKAVEAWNHLQPDPTIRAAIQAALSRQRISGQWVRDGGRFIPYAATYLNQRRWEDGPTSLANDAGLFSGIVEFEQRGKPALESN